jgi:hypothetical protein
VDRIGNKKLPDKNALKGLLALVAMLWSGMRLWVSDVREIATEGICIKHKNNKQLTPYCRTLSPMKIRTNP